jgi:hypothetical protein
VLSSEPGDSIPQSDVLQNIIRTPIHELRHEEEFNRLRVKTMKLSAMRDMYRNKEEKAALNTLAGRHEIAIDERFRVRLGEGRTVIETSETMLDYMLTVGKSIGVESILPNGVNITRFTFEMDLKQPHREFKGKHGLTGFDTKGRMLFIGQAMGEDVFLAMAPNAFIRCEEEPCAAGHNTGSSVMARRHSRQVTMMLLYCLQGIRERSFFLRTERYPNTLESEVHNWSELSSAM